MNRRVPGAISALAITFAFACGGAGGSGDGSEALRWQWLAVSPAICDSCGQTTDDPNFGRQMLLPHTPPGWGVIGYNTPQPGVLPWFEVRSRGDPASFEFFLDNGQNHQNWPDGTCRDGSCVPPFVGVLARPELGTMPAGLRLDGGLGYEVRITLGSRFGLTGESVPCASSSGKAPFARLEVGAVFHDGERNRNWWISWSLFRQAWPDFFCGIDGCFLFLNSDAGLVADGMDAHTLGPVGPRETLDLAFDLSRAVVETLRLGRERACPLPELDPAATLIGIWVGAEVHGEAVAQFTVENLRVGPKLTPRTPSPGESSS